MASKASHGPFYLHTDVPFSRYAKVGTPNMRHFVSPKDRDSARSVFLPSSEKNYSWKSALFRLTNAAARGMLPLLLIDGASPNGGWLDCLPQKTSVFRIAHVMLGFVRNAGCITAPIFGCGDMPAYLYA